MWIMSKTETVLFIAAVLLAVAILASAGHL